MRECVSDNPGTSLLEYPAVADCVFLSCLLLGVIDRSCQAFGDHDVQAYAQPPGYR